MSTSSKTASRRRGGASRRTSWTRCSTAISGWTNWLTDKRKTQADGCTIAALLLMNAAMLHQRIAAGGWLPGISGMDEIKSAPDAIMEVSSQWNRIIRHDFQPVIAPAVDIIEEVQRSGRKTGLNRALRHLAGEAERIAESYADLGADHAGPLFNKVMGNQASDGAYFTRPPAAALLARLILDAARPGGGLDRRCDMARTPDRRSRLRLRHTHRRNAGRNETAS